MSRPTTLSPRVSAMADAKYEKISMIGQGPTAVVFDGRSRDLGLQVAIKELTPEWRSNTRRRERVFQAAGRSAQVAHDNLVKYLDVDLAHSWIIMQRMEESAGAKMQRGATDPVQVRATLQQALEALRHVHLAGLLHANLKPNNILFDQNGRAFLGDGLAVRRDSPGELPAPTTQKYLAPELISGEAGTLGGGVDLYCLGFVLLEMLAGPAFETHFQGIGADAMDSNTAWMRWHASAEKAPSARDVAPTCPANLGIVIDRLLLKNPIERYQRAEDALEDLLNPIHEQAASTPPPGRPAESAPAAAAHSGPAASPAPPVPAPAPAARKAMPKPQQPPSAPGAPTGVRPASAGDIAPRPNTGVMLRIASGHRAGQMVGTDDDNFLIGGSGDCLVALRRNPTRTQPTYVCECVATPTAGRSAMKPAPEAGSTRSRSWERRHCGRETCCGSAGKAPTCSS